MSRFWTQTGSDSEEEEVEESESEESESEDDVGKRSKEDQSKSNQYLKSGSDSDESEDRKREVKSAKDKRFEEMAMTVEQIKNQIKINDWVSLQESFEKINKQLEKVLRVTESNKPPNIYLRSLILLEDFLNQTLQNKESKKKMSTSNAKALNYMKQKLKKNNKVYEEAIEKLRQTPESEDEGVKGSDEEESDEDDNFFEGEAKGEDLGSEEEEGKDDEGWERGKKKEKVLERDPTKITWDIVNNKLREILAVRGKKGINRNEQIEQLVYLSTVAKTPAQKLEILLSIISCQFDINLSFSTHMPTYLWKNCVENVFAILDILGNYNNIVLDDTTDIELERETEKGEDYEGKIRVFGNLVVILERLDDELFKSLQSVDPHTKEYTQRLKDELVFLALAESVQTYLEDYQDFRGASRVALRRVEHIYYKPQNIYNAMRVLSESDLFDIDKILNEYLSDEEDDIESVNYSNSKKINLKLSSDFPHFISVERKVSRIAHFPKNGRQIMDELVSKIYAHGDERIKARAILCDVYHHALHEHFYVARDLLLISHLQDTVQNMDISSQILFNRAMAQLGICAFKCALIPEALSCLTEIFSGGKVKELLAQGLSQSRYHDKNPEQEKLERRRQMPYHMHINLELLESVHLISGMILEVSSMSSQIYDLKKKVISKTFRRLLDNYDRQVFNGPPENVRDNIIYATKCLLNGDWKKSVQLCQSLDTWKLFPSPVKERILETIKQKIQEEALRAYLFSYSSFYSSISLEQLVQMFEMTELRVKSIVSRMIFNNELGASWNEPNATLVIHDIEPSRLQNLAIQFTDKLNVLVESNEKALEAKTGNVQTFDSGAKRTKDRQDGPDFRRDRDDMGFNSRGGRSGFGSKAKGGLRSGRQNYGDRKTYGESSGKYGLKSGPRY